MSEKKRIGYNVRCKNEDELKTIRELVLEEKRIDETISETLIRILKNYKKLTK